jgi:hypothetical protein
MASVYEMMVGFGFCTVHFNALPLHSAEPKEDHHVVTALLKIEIIRKIQ